MERDIKAEQSKTITGKSLTLTLTITKGANNPGCFFGLESITLHYVSPKDVAFQNLLSVYDTYYEYYDSFTPGTMPGQYGAEEVAAFRAVLDLVANLDGPDSNIEAMTAEELNNLAEQIEATYQAVINSRVYLSIANGYYHIKNGGQAYSETYTDEETGESETVTIDKYMYVTKNGATLNGVWGSVEDLGSHAPSLWKLTDHGQGNFELMNMGYDAQFNPSTGTSAAYTLQTDSAEMMYITPAAYEGDKMYVNIRVASQTGAYQWIHQGGHGGGAGKSGNLVAWSASDGNDRVLASEWQLVPVSDEDAQAIIDAYAPIKDRAIMLANFDSIMTNAKANLKIAYDRKALITENSQFSSPYTCTSEGSINYMLDGDVNTYWHSEWQNTEDPPMDMHYLQVEIHEADLETVEKAVAVVGRRTVINNHVTVMNVRGTNVYDAEKEDCEMLAENLEVPFDHNGELGVETPEFELKGYKYIRFYPVVTIGQTAQMRGFFHFSEFQLYDVNQPETTQANMLGELYTNLEELVNEYEGLERDDIEIDQYNALKAAYDAFMAKFVDPTELRNTMRNTKDVLAAVRTGKNDPGFWSSESAGDAFKATYDAAKAYDAAGVYTTEQSADYVEKLNQQSKDIYANAIQVQTGKWYRIRFPEEEDYEDYGWDKVAGNGSVNSDGVETIPSLFGKYVSVANQITEDGIQYVESIEAENVAVGHTLHMLAEGDMTYPENSLFRFIAVGDSAYILQNKGTGLFVKATGSTGSTIISAHPTLFNVSAIGYGLNAIAAKNLTGANQNYLHVQVSGNMLVTWGVNTVGSRSALYIEEVEDVADDYDGTAFNVELKPGAVAGYCFPVEVSVPEDTDAQMWTVNSINALDEDSLSLSISLAQIEGNVAPAGRPFILVYGAPEEYNAEDEADMVVLKHGYAIGAKEAETTHALKGTFTGGSVSAGTLLPTGNEIVLNKSNTTIAANSAYIHPGWTINTKATIEVVFDAGAADGIQSALQSVSHSGAVYTIDGRLVSKKAGLNDLQKFGKGVYILNGTKVIVK